MNLCPHETNISESAKDFDINWRRIAPIFPEGSLATLLLLPEKSEPAKELRDDFIIVGGMHMYLYTKSIAMALCSVTAALAVALTGLAEDSSTPDASSMPYTASQSQAAGMPDSSTVPGPTSETAPGAAGTADSAISEAPGPDTAQREETGSVPAADIEEGEAGMPDASPDSDETEKNTANAAESPVDAGEEEDGAPRAVQRGDDGGELHQHLGAVLAPLDHFPHRLQMALGAGDAVEDSLGLGVGMVVGVGVVVDLAHWYRSCWGSLPRLGRGRLGIQGLTPGPCPSDGHTRQRPARPSAGDRSSGR